MSWVEVVAQGLPLEELRDLEVEVLEFAAEGEGDGVVVAQGRTDVEGRFKTATVRVGATCTARIRTPGLHGGCYEQVHDGALTTLELSILRAVPLHLEVRDLGGGPVHRAMVRFENDELGLQLLEFSDADGCIRVERFPDVPMWLEVTRKDFVGQFDVPFRATPGTPQVLRLDPGRTLRVTVPRPPELAFITVHLMQGNASLARRPLVEGQSEVVFTGVPRERVEVTFQRDAIVNALSPLRVAAEVHDTAVVLPAK